MYSEHGFEALIRPELGQVCHAFDGRIELHPRITATPGLFRDRHNAFVGIELVPKTHQLCLMNLTLHGIESMVDIGDTLSPDGERIGKADLILTNPPFGSKRGGGRPTRSDFSV